MQKPFEKSRVFAFPEGLCDARILEFSHFAESVPSGQSALLRISAQQGARTNAVNAVASIADSMKARDISLHAFGGVFISGFMRIFLLADQRIVGPESAGMIHLPVLTASHRSINGVSNAALQKVREEIALFIAERTKLDMQDVFFLNEKRLSPKKMIEYGIAHEIMQNPETLVALR